jgi:hypothetical protein
MERSEIQWWCIVPDCAALHPGYWRRSMQAAQASPQKKTNHRKQLPLPGDFHPVTYFRV